MVAVWWQEYASDMKNSKSLPNKMTAVLHNIGNVQRMVSLLETVRVKTIFQNEQVTP